MANNKKLYVGNISHDLDNDALKEGGVIDIPQWRFIQRLGDLRNLCDHNKDREPTKDEVAELIDGVDKLTKTVF